MAKRSEKLGAGDELVVVSTALVTLEDGSEMVRAEYSDGSYELFRL